MSVRHARVEADDATRGSAVKLGAEVVSRLIGFVMPLLLLHGLGVPAFGVYGQLAVTAQLLAELGELGLQSLASRALVAGSHSLGSLVRARVVSTALGGAVALAVLGGAAQLSALATAAAGGLGSARRYELDGRVLALLMAWFLLSGWGEFFGVALRCRRARWKEAVLLLVLRAGALLAVAPALVAGSGLLGVSLALALSPLPALALGAAYLRRTDAGVSGASLAPLAVLRDSAPLAVQGALLLLSPRVEFLVLSLASPGAEAGLFFAALIVMSFLSMVATAIAAGAMPALTREALRGEGLVRRRCASTLALLGTSSAVGLALVAEALAAYLPNGAATVDAAGLVLALRVMSVAVPALFVNALLAAALIAAGRAGWLPWLTAARVALAFVLAIALVPRFGTAGAALGLAVSEWALLGLGATACARTGFRVPFAGTLALGLVACGPMALAVHGVNQNLLLALAVGGSTWLATLLAASRLFPGLVRQLTGDLRYP